MRRHVHECGVDIHPSTVITLRRALLLPLALASRGRLEGIVASGQALNASAISVVFLGVERRTMSCTVVYFSNNAQIAYGSYSLEATSSAHVAYPRSCASAGKRTAQTTSKHSLAPPAASPGNGSAPEGGGWKPPAPCGALSLRAWMRFVMVPATRWAQDTFVEVAYSKDLMVIVRRWSQSPRAEYSLRLLVLVLVLWLFAARVCQCAVGRFQVESQGGLTFET
ncbi:hypothetical protein C8Q79DRAFT_928655 [Trametes meyenii]|nr:hypothetical protein C8Q79DRAFT_928655 [Trametes meyenii]